MLNIMRKRAGGWMIKIILFAIVVVFSLWGVGNFQDQQATKVAEVNGEVITRTAYGNAYNQLRENYRQAYGDQINEGLMQMLRPGQQALDQLITRVLMLQEAARLDLSVADNELITTIQKIPAFQNNGVFAQDQYRAVLARNNSTPEQFEQSYREELAVDKLRRLILNGVVASEEEALAWYESNNAQVSLDYIKFSPAKYGDMDPSEEELATYFKENEETYRTAPQIKARYLHFDPKDYTSLVSVDDDAVKQYYNDNKQQFVTEKTIEARHILFKLGNDADEKTIAQKKAKAMDVYEMAKQGQNFATLATQFSEGPSKDQGGALGVFGRGTMVKPFSDKAFSMKAGEISEPVRTQFGWHLIKVEKINAATSKSIDEATSQIRERLTTDKARDLARDKAEEAYDAVFDGDDLTDAGKTFQVPVQTTGFFTAEGVRQRGIDDPTKFTQIAFGLKTMDISEIETLGDGYYLIQVFDRAEPKIPELSTVTEKVRIDLVKARQDEKAQAEAAAAIEKIKAGAPFVEAAAEYKLQPAETGLFKRSGAIPTIGAEPQIAQQAFQLSEKSPINDQPIKGKDGWFVIQLKERQAPPAQDFGKEKAALLQRLTDQKKRETFSRWVADLRARSKVSVNQEQLITP